MHRMAVIFGLILVAWAANSQPPEPGAAQASEPPQRVAAERANQPNPDQRGAEDRPLFVKPIIPPKSEKEAAQDQQDRQEKAAADRWMEILTAAIAVIGGIQAVVFGIQARRLKQTVEAMKIIDQGQSAKVTESITQATRAAAAMEKVSESLAINATQIVESVKTTQTMATNQREFWTRQMRAYISVNPGAVIDQDTTPGFRFEAQPIVQNDGLTPAYELTFIGHIKLLPVPLPAGFDFDLTKEESPDTRSVTTMNPRNNSFMILTSDSYYSPSEKEEYRKPGGRRLYTWGNVNYKDVNGTPHTTNFCFFTIWGSKDNPVSIRTTRHNDSD
jgi:hypothetical protein